MKTFALPCVWLLLSWTKRPFSPCLPYPTLDSVAMETHSLAGKGFCIPVGDCYKCAVSPLCVCVCFGETVPPLLSLFEAVCTSVFVCKSFFFVCLFLEALSWNSRLLLQTSLSVQPVTRTRHSVGLNRIKQTNTHRI